MQKAVSAYLKSKQLPPFGFARQHDNNDRGVEAFMMNSSRDWY